MNLLIQKKTNATGKENMTFCLRESFITKKLNMLLPLLRQQISNEDKNTTEIFKTEKLIGKVRTIRINKKIIKGLNSVIFFINRLSLFKIRNVRQPAAISQNLVGIKKYAAL